MTLSSRYIVASVSLIGTMVGTGVAPAQELPADERGSALFDHPRLRADLAATAAAPGNVRDHAVGAALLEKLCPAPCANLDRRAAANKLEVSSADWSVQVMGDGTAARYQNLEVGRRMRSIGRDPSQKMSSEELARAGRAYIEANLTSVTPLGLDEQIVPTRIDYRFEAGLDLRTQKSHARDRRQSDRVRADHSRRAGGGGRWAGRSHLRQ